jgi:hypothetical protein
MDTSPDPPPESAGNRSGIIRFAQQHRKLTVALASILASLIAWSAVLQTADEDPFLSGTVAQVAAGLIVFLLINQYVVWLRVVPKMRKLKGRDMSFHAALAQAGAAPFLGMGAAVATGLDWPFWTCIALGLVSSIGPLSVLSVTARRG